MLKFINKLFGSKSDRDIKAVKPLVDKIKEEYEKLSSISHDDLRAKTLSFKEKITEALAAIDTQIADIKGNVESNPNMPLHEKTAAYDEVDKLEKDRNKQLEAILLEILPEAFAVMKDTARRFTENEIIEVTASSFDR